MSLGFEASHKRSEGAQRTPPAGLHVEYVGDVVAVEFATAVEEEEEEEEEEDVVVELPAGFKQNV